MFRYLINCFKSPDPPQVITVEEQFLLMFVEVYKRVVADVTSEMFGTTVDASKLNVDPLGDTFMDDVKELLASTQTLEIDIDKPLTYRLLKQIEKNELLNKKRDLLRSFYQLKKRSVDQKRPIKVDDSGNFHLGELSLNSISDAVQDSIVKSTG